MAYNALFLRYTLIVWPINDCTFGEKNVWRRKIIKKKWFNTHILWIAGGL